MSDVVAVPKIELIKRKFKRDGQDFWVRIEGAPSFDSIQAMFKNVRPYLQNLSQEARTNIYYTQGLTTLANPEKKHSRKYHGQTMLLFDVDHIIKDREKDLVECLLSALNLDRNKTIIISTGYGIQLAILFETLFTSNETIRQFYAKKCDYLEQKIRESGLMGEKTNVDRSVADPNKLARLGDTINHKPGREDREAIFVNANIEPQYSNIESFLNIPVMESQSSSDSPELVPIEVDSAAIESGCTFLREVLALPKDLHEPEVRAASAILKFLDNGETRAQDLYKKVREEKISETVSNFSDTEISKRVSQLKVYSCKKIESLDPRGACLRCPHYNKVSSPINIQSKEFAMEASLARGFRTLQQNGKPGRIDYETLANYFESKVGTLVTDKNQPTRVIYLWDKNHYRHLSPSTIELFALDHVTPLATDNERKEFLSFLGLKNMVDLTDLLYRNTEGKINFRNGVLNIDSGNLNPHSKDEAFTHVLDFDYDHKSVCPLFHSALAEWMEGVEDNIETLQMFGGYVLAGGEPLAHKALILTGLGRNGKSAFYQILDGILGGDKSNAVMSMNAEDFNRQHMMAELQTKQLVVMDEQKPHLAKTFWEELKRLSAGGKVSAAKKFQHTNTFFNRAKFILIMNEFSSGTSHTEGFLSRLLVVNFPHFIPPEKRNPFLVKTILDRESAGVARWFAEGFKKLRDKYKYQFPETAPQREVIEEYRMETNNVFAFIKEIGLELGDPNEPGFAIGDSKMHVLGKGLDTSGVLFGELYDRFNEWIKDQYADGDSYKFRMSKIGFSKRIRQHFNGAVKVKIIKSNQKIKKILAGVRLKAGDV